MGLLDQTQPQGQNAAAMQTELMSGATQQGQEPDGDEQQQQGGGLSFTTEQLVDSFKQNMEPEQAKDMGLVIDEGKDLLFGPETHSQLMGMLEGSKDIGADLGNGAFDAMNLVLHNMAKQKPNEEIDGKAILPAGLALISMALEFINESGMAPVNDDTFEQASHIFSTKMMDTYEPEFRQRREQYQAAGGDAGAQAAPDQTQPAGAMPVQTQPATGAM